MIPILLPLGPQGCRCLEVTGDVHVGRTSQARFKHYSYVSGKIGMRFSFANSLPDWADYQKGKWRLPSKLSTGLSTNVRIDRSSIGQDVLFRFIVCFFFLFFPSKIQRSANGLDQE